MSKVVLSLVFLLSVFISACSDADESTLSEAAPVVPVTPVSLAESGASSYPQNISEVTNLVTSALDDGIITNLTALFDDEGDPIPACGTRSIRRLVRSISSQVDTKITEISNLINNFETTKSFATAIAFSETDFDSYWRLKSATAQVSLSAKTTDGGALNEANFSSASGTGKASVDIVAINLPVNSIIKAAQIRCNATTTVSMGSKASIDEYDNSTYRDPANISVSYDVKLSLGMSIKNSLGMGGKIIFSASTKNSITIADPDQEPSWNTLAPSFTLGLEVLNDAGVQVYSKSYTTLEAFMNDFAPETPDTEYAQTR